MSRVSGVCLLLGLSAGVWAQQQGSTSSNQRPADSSPTKAGTPESSGTTSNTKPAKAQAPSLAPPRSDRVDAGALGDQIGESSSKDTQIDLSPPVDDVRTHPQSSEAVADAESEATGGTSVGEFHTSRARIITRPRIDIARRCATRTMTRSRRFAWRCAWRSWRVPMTRGRNTRVT